MSSSKIDPSEVEKVPARGGTYYYRHKLLDIPADVKAAILAAPLRNTVVGDGTTSDSIIRTTNFQFAYHSKFVFEIGKGGAPIPPFLVIAAKNLFIVTPDFSEFVSRITYESFVNLDSPDQTLRGADGISYSPFNESGNSGGRGEHGPDGLVGGTLLLPPIYFLFQKVFLSAPLPVAVEIILLDFHGATGGRGGMGGRGGNGGRGATGTPSEVGPTPVGPECKAGPGDGGNGGDAGLGGKGGDGGRGGKGGMITVAAPDDMIYEYAGFFGSDVSGGFGGPPGPPGPNGSYGTHGDAGFKSVFCSQGANHGSDGHYPEPPDLGPGAKGSVGEPGHINNFGRDNSDLF